MSRWTLRCGLALARRWLPFELEGFFRSHFTKMRRQSEAQLREYIELGERHGQPVDALKQLVAQVFGGGSPPAASRG